MSSTTPILADISGYGNVLAWTDAAPANAAALGNLLASYYALGSRRLTIATYAFSTPWAITGTVMTGANDALTNASSNGNVAGSIVPTVPGDPIFANGVLTGVTFFHNANFAHSANGIVNLNLYPGAQSPNNAAFFRLVAATLQQGATTVPAVGTFAMALLAMGIVAAGLFLLRPRASQEQAYLGILRKF